MLPSAFVILGLGTWKAKIFTKLNLRNAYYLARIRERDE